MIEQSCSNMHDRIVNMTPSAGVESISMKPSRGIEVEVYLDGLWLMPLNLDPGSIHVGDELVVGDKRNTSPNMPAEFKRVSVVGRNWYFGEFSPRFVILCRTL